MAMVATGIPCSDAGHAPEVPDRGAREPPQDPPPRPKKRFKRRRDAQPDTQSAGAVRQCLPWRDVICPALVTLYTMLKVACPPIGRVWEAALVGGTYAVYGAVNQYVSCTAAVAVAAGSATGAALACNFAFPGAVAKNTKCTGVPNAGLTWSAWALFSETEAFLSRGPGRPLGAAFKGNESRNDGWARVSRLARPRALDNAPRFSEHKARAPTTRPDPSPHRLSLARALPVGACGG